MKDPGAFRTISEVAEDLDLPQHVLRFWETRFTQIKPMKRGGGRRYYRPEDVDLLRGIRFLLYSDGFTIRGVQRLLKEKGLSFVVAVGQGGSTQAAGSREMRAAESDMMPEREIEEDFPPEPRFETEENEDVRPPSIVQLRMPSAPAPAPAGVARLSKEDRRRLDLALSELIEAKRILDQVR